MLFYCFDAAEAAAGFLKTRITLSPRKNIFATYLSLLTGFAFFPFPLFGVSVHISLQFSKTMLQWRSNARTLANIFLLFRQLINTWVLSLTDWVSTDRGPVLNSSSSFCFSSSRVSSLLGFALDHNSNKRFLNTETTHVILYRSTTLHVALYLTRMRTKKEMSFN